MNQSALACLALLGLSATPAAAVVAAGGDGATGITLAPGALDPIRLNLALTTAATSNCFLTSIRIGGIETCTTPIGIPLLCIRMRNNYLTNILESTGRRQHFSVQTESTALFLEIFAATAFAAPTNKKLGQDSGESAGNSSSGRVQARSMAPPLIYGILSQVVTGLSFATLCQPFGGSGPARVGYFYFADADETPGGSTWRSIISPYYLNGMTSGMSLYAKGLETSGLCSLDANYLVCLGGFGTKYPTSGDISAGSPALRLITGMWRASEVTAASAGVWGPYDVAVGAAIHSQMHLPESYPSGYYSMTPSYQPGSYMQWLYPGTTAGSPVGVPDRFCYVLGVGAGTAPQVATQTLSEAINKTYSEEDTFAMAYWARWTCCNWCAASNESPARHAVPEGGFDAVHTRLP